MGNSQNKAGDRSINQQSFDLLLKWLDPDPDRAAYRYEKIRQKLIRIFTWRGCSNSEELADITIDRVTREVSELSSNYIGNPEAYFSGVARDVFNESPKRRVTNIEPDSFASEPFKALEAEIELEKRHECLNKCLNNLSPANREMAIRYYQEEKAHIIDARRQLAEELSIPINALRIRVHRIKGALAKCLQECLEENVVKKS
jgi:DNA-directed RNA polymerase specialized sigma24 family protein